MTSEVHAAQGTSQRIVRIGTRGSALALRQTELIIRLLKSHTFEREFQVCVVQTQGDREQSRSITELGDKGIFVRPLEQRLLTGEIELAIHSLKDVPVDEETAGLCLPAFSPRADARDAIISASGAGVMSLSSGSRIGTGSLRRRCQILAIRPDLEVVGIRGNVDTRLRKLDDGEYDAVVLAAAGLERLGLTDIVSEYLDPDVCVPAAGQGIIAVQARSGGWAADLASSIDDVNVRAEAVAERAVVTALGATCHSPIGALAVREGRSLSVRAVAALEDCSCLSRGYVEGDADDAEQLGLSLGRELRQKLVALRSVDAASFPILGSE